jgi:formylglycine-generating enzyme required for sulfatase activity
MLRTYRILIACFLGYGILLIGSCSEDSVTSSQDKTVPTVQMIHPTMVDGLQEEVSDYVDVFATASDNTSVSKVELWGSPETTPDAVLIEEFDAPIDPVPDSIGAPPGSSVYGTRWSVRSIRNGTRVRLFARAYDPNGNSTRSDLVTVKVLNRGGDLRPPVARFFIEPTQGTVDTLFVFNASDTSDSVDAPTEISVRWDFDGDGVWDRDWDAGLKASIPVEFKYTRASIYYAKLEAKNTYLPDSVGRATQPLDVAPSGGKDPEPPEPGNMILIAPGTYRVGTADPALANRNELPVHSVRLTADYYIEKTEVSNHLYLKYLKVAMAGETPEVRREGNSLWRYPSEGEPQKIVDFSYSALFYDPDGDSVAVMPEARMNPVVGVTWYGAKAYAENYGLRLPTEHEWEIAAKADSVNFNYSWGKTITPAQANYVDSGFRAMRPIGSYPTATSPWGVLDMSGNAAEWVKDWYASYPSQDQINPEGPVTGELKVTRGGGCLSSAMGVRVTARTAAEPSLASEHIGFRTAYTKP